MSRSASVRLLDGKYRSVDLDGCVVLAMTNNPIAVLALDRLAARLAESHARPEPAAGLAEIHVERIFSPSRQCCDLIPRAFYRDRDGLPFAEATPSFGPRREPAEFLEIPRAALAEFLDRAGFDAATRAEWIAADCRVDAPKPPKKPRDRGLTARCLEEIVEAFRKGDRPPTYTELKWRIGSKSLRTPRDAYIRFHRSQEYARWIQDGGKPWGPKVG
jgi:hypothetical protein